MPESPPSHDDMVADPNAQAALAGYLVRRYVDKVKVEAGHNDCKYSLHFEH
jgi:hypothetical protein